MTDVILQPRTGHILALSGGVGGAKLALGLSRVLAPEQLTIVANTADDFEHLGLSISPDLDTLMYTLAGLNNRQMGWGLADESWNAMTALEQLGGETWFRLGDKDLATHLQRSTRLAAGCSLSQVTRELCQQLGIMHPVVPMSDQPVRTMLNTAAGELSFQHYFVREQCQPAVHSYRFAGIEQAQPQQDVMQWLTNDDLQAIIICPSNPFVSVEPMLQLSGLRQAMIDSPAPVIAVSPIVAGQALKGPAAKMMTEMNMPVTASAVAGYYGDLLDGFVIDNADGGLADDIAASGIAVACVPTVMKSLEDRVSLAQAVLSFSGQLKSP